MHLSGARWSGDVAARLARSGFGAQDIERLAGREPGAPSAPLAEFAQAFDAHAGSVSKLVVVSLVPMFAALLAVAFLRSKRRSIDHLVLSTHFIAWWIGFAVVLVLPLFEGLAVLLRSHFPELSWLRGDAVFVPVELGLITLWLGLASRRFYGSGRGPLRWIRALGLGLGLLVLVVVPLRRLEFLCAWWTL